MLYFVLESVKRTKKRTKSEEFKKALQHVLKHSPWRKGGSKETKQRTEEPEGAGEREDTDES